MLHWSLFLYGDNANDELADSYFNLLSKHFMSYDMWSRPYRTYELPPIENVYQQFSSHCCYELTGFWPTQLQEICQNLFLIDDRIAALLQDAVLQKILLLLCYFEGGTLVVLGNWLLLI